MYIYKITFRIYVLKLASSVSSHLQCIETSSFLIQLRDAEMNSFKFIYLAQDAKFNSQRRRDGAIGNI